MSYDDEENKVIRALAALVSIARSNWPSNSGDVTISVGGRNSASVVVGWDVLHRLLSRLKSEKEQSE